MNIKVQQPPQTTSKARLLPKKIIFSVWWNSRLTKLNQAIRTKRPKLANCRSAVVFHRNIRLHDVTDHPERISLDWDVLLYPEYIHRTVQKFEKIGSNPQKNLFIVAESIS
ncbi:PREDICTED: uncharacterized protein LOC105456692 [Wasmannia auropunctata]|uniref:uncharacterized protein LOC105456692 n=1 Tax=Wasmannia auropunctata TaxID=64793 RepID=UPI0005F01C56|nr:PREDICTED: uncharacterized protein LOC105456692 [Wasmannia auropunctata]